MEEPHNRGYKPLQQWKRGWVIAKLTAMVRLGNRTYRYLAGR